MIYIKHKLLIILTLYVYIYIYINIYIYIYIYIHIKIKSIFLCILFSLVHTIESQLEEKRLIVTVAR